MSEVAIDFGTSNTVLACYNETTERAETIRVPQISSELRYRLTPEGNEHTVWVVPSVTGLTLHGLESPRYGGLYHVLTPIRGNQA